MALGHNLHQIVQELNKGILSAVEMVTHLMETFQNQGKGKGKGKRKGDAEFGETKPAAEPDPLPTKKARLSKDAICHLRNCKLY